MAMTRINTKATSLTITTTVVIQVDILISQNQALQILYLKHHNNEFKTS